MAKYKRKHHSKKGGHRRRVGALGGLDIKTPLMVTAGAVGATYLINGPMKTTSWINIAAIGGGILIQKFAPSMAAVGAGMVAAGGISILQNANVISGVGRVIINGGPPGAMPISSVAGRNLNRMPANSRAALQTRMNAAGANRVVVGGPISSVAGYDPCDL
jgi:hypothetical protein